MDGKAKDQIYKVRSDINLVQELQSAMPILVDGLTIYRHNHPSDIHYYSFMLLLSSGLERLMKVLLMLNSQKIQNRYLTKKEMQKLGHSLESLCAEIITRCYTEDYISKKPIAKTDYNFITSDPIFIELLKVLSDFASRDRYSYLNEVSEPKETLDKDPDPDEVDNDSPRRWQEFESSQISAKEILYLHQVGKYEEARQNNVTVLIACIEKFIRALARIFVYSDLGDQARNLSGVFYFFHFLHLRDEDLGKTLYIVDFPI